MKNQDTSSLAKGTVTISNGSAPIEISYQEHEQRNGRLTVRTLSDEEAREKYGTMIFIGNTPPRPKESPADNQDQDHEKPAE